MKNGGFALVALVAGQLLISGNPPLPVTYGGTSLTQALDDRIMIGNGSIWESKSVGDCDNPTTSKLLYSTETNSITCGSDQTGGGGGGTTYVMLSADVVNATTTLADLTGLSWAVAASTNYDISCKIAYTANATTTGALFTWTGPATPTLVSGRMVVGLTTTTIGSATLTGNDSGAVATSSVAASPVLNHASVDGIWRNGINAGTLQIRFRSEVAVANAIVAKAGSICQYSTF